MNALQREQRIPPPAAAARNKFKTSVVVLQLAWPHVPRQPSEHYKQTHPAAAHSGKPRLSETLSLLSAIYTDENVSRMKLNETYVTYM